LVFLHFTLQPSQQRVHALFSIVLRVILRFCSAAWPQRFPCFRILYTVAYQWMGEREAQWPGHRIIGVAEKSQNVASTLFNTVHLLSKDLRFENGGVQIVSCPALSNLGTPLIRPMQQCRGDGVGAQARLDVWRRSQKILNGGARAW